MLEENLLINCSKNSPKFLPVGDRALSVEFGKEMTKENNLRVISLYNSIKNKPIVGITSTLPTYRSLLVYYNPLIISINELITKLENLLTRNGYYMPSGRLLRIPVIYGNNFGPDLQFVAEHNRLTTEEVIELHSSTEYLVAMMGFSPGFPYLSGLPQELSVPRLPTPRVKIPAGSVGIAGTQTGIYPQDSPGGWRIIGWTPFNLFDPDRDPPLILEIGDRVRFLRMMEEEEARKLAKTLEESLILSQKHIKTTSIKQKISASNIGTFTILKSGLFTTIQDHGRFGCESYGIPPSGAADKISMVLANKLVGNTGHEAVLEITLLGEDVELLFNHPSLVALAGGKLTVKVNNKEMPLREGFTVKKGDVITLSDYVEGLRTYLAVSGGIQTPQFLESRSTYVSGKFGGFQGRMIREGDMVPFIIRDDLKSYRTSIDLSTLAQDFLTTQKPVKIRVVAGPQEDYFTLSGLNTFYNSEYEISSDSDRKGLRLTGPTIERQDVGEIVSDGTPPGSIQITGSGIPLIILNDGPTTGGYPKIGVVVTPDLDLLAQLRPGDFISFEKVSLEMAHRLYGEYRKTLDLIKKSELTFTELSKEAISPDNLEERDIDKAKLGETQTFSPNKKYLFKIDDKEYEVQVEIL